MKMIFVGVWKDSFSTSHSQARGFEANGVEVVKYDFKARLDVLNDFEARDNELVTVIQRENPDFVLFAKCACINLRVIHECNKISKSVFWFMDASHNFDATTQSKVEDCSLAISGVEGVWKKMLQLNPNSFFVHQCPDEMDNFKIKGIQKEYDVLFIGNIAGPMHANRLKYLQECGVYNNNINRHHIKNVYGQHHNKLVNQSKINLNFSPVDLSGVSVRLFKLLASGGFVLTTPWNNMENTFTVGKHFDVFTSVSEMNQKIEFYLNDASAREAIAKNGHALTQNNFMPVNWASKILSRVKKII